VRAPRGFSALPVAFEPNRGQARAPCEFVARSPDGVALLDRSGFLFASGRERLRVTFAGGQATEAAPVGRRPGVSHFLRGPHPSKWLRDVPRYGSVFLRSVWPGVDARFVVRGNRLAFDFLLWPQTRPDRVVLSVEGASALEVSAEGDLLIEGRYGRGRLSAPLAWQDSGAGCRAVAAHFELRAGNRVAILAPGADPAAPLVIDPTFTWATYLGGSAAEDYRPKVKMHSSGYAYAAASTQSSDFPVTPDAYGQEREGVVDDVCVAKIDLDGTSLVYATYIGGTKSDEIRDLDVDEDGCAYVSGYTGSTDFPTTSGAWSRDYGRGFVTKLSSDGSDLVWSTYVGLGIADTVAVDAEGRAHVALAYETGTSTYCRMYLLRLKEDGSGLEWSTYLDQSGDQPLTFYGLAIGPEGEVVACGATYSATLKTTAEAFQRSRGGQWDGFVLKYDSSGGLVFATYLGGQDLDHAYGVGIDAAGDVLIVGHTYSTDFPVSTDAYQSTHGGGRDMYLARLSADGTSLRYSTLFGGTGLEDCRGLAVHFSGTAWILGTSSSDDLATDGAWQETRAGSADALMAQFDHNGDLAFATYIGGSDLEDGCDVAVGGDGSGCGIVMTTSTDCPTSDGAVQTALAGVRDLYVFAFSDDLPEEPVEMLSAIVPEWTAEIPFELDFEHAGGLAPYTWSLAGGELPSGVELSASGTLTGTPHSAGVFAFTVEVEDGFGMTGSTDFSWTVNPFPAISTVALPGVTAGRPYTEALAHAGGTAPFTWIRTAGSPPTGITLSEEGEFEGSSDAIGDYGLSVMLRDGVGAETPARALSLRVNAWPAIPGEPLPACTESRPYPTILPVTGGTAPFAWSLESGTAPTLRGVDPTGAFTGVCRAAGIYSGTYRVTDASGATATGPLSVTVNPYPSILTLRLPPAGRDRPYLTRIEGAGGTPPFAFSLAAGVLPAGLVLDEIAGTVSGTPSASGSFPLDVRCRDSCGAVASAQWTLTVADDALLASGKSGFDGDMAVGAPLARYLELLGGSVLSLSVSLTGFGTPGASVELLAGDGSPVDLGPFLTAKGAKISAKAIPIPATGRYFLTVTPNAEFLGRASVALKIAAPRATGTTGQIPLDLRFAALPGAVASISVKAAKGSSALPSIAHLFGPDGTELLDPGAVTVKGGSATLKRSSPLAGGDHRVVVEGREGTSGSVVVTVKLKQPKGYAFSLPDLVSGSSD
jgi:hypothetical protein